jgi:hypothetical protein
LRFPAGIISASGCGARSIFFATTAGFLGERLNKLEGDLIKIYVAGALSGTALQYLENMRRMMSISVQFWLMGMAPYCPCLDYQYFLMRPELEDRPGIDVFYKASLVWVDVSDAVLVLPNWENSRGTQEEMAQACKCNVPIFFKPSDLINYFCFPPDPRLDVLFEKWEGEKI